MKITGRIGRNVSLILIILVISSCANFLTNEVVYNNSTLKKEYRVRKITKARHGHYKEYINDLLHTEGNYKSDKREGQWTLHNKNGMVIKGTYRNDKPDGKWMYYRNGRLVITDVYDKGQLIKEKRIKHTETVEESPGKVDDDVYTIVQEAPEFNGGDVLTYLRKTAVYPSLSRDLGIQGTVWIEFVVNKFGEVTETKIVKSPQGAEELKKEALRAVNNLPRFSPAFQSGEPVMVRFTVPINFKIK